MLHLGKKGHGIGGVSNPPMSSEFGKNKNRTFIFQSNKPYLKFT